MVITTYKCDLCGREATKYVRVFVCEIRHKTDAHRIEELDLCDECERHVMGVLGIERDERP